MKIFEMDCYEVRETDGGGMRTDHIMYCSTRTLAEEVANHVKGWRSVNAYKKTIKVFDTIEEVDENSVANLRKSAIAKLTAAEREALGL
jgi:hypothetical protein